MRECGCRESWPQKFARRTIDVFERAGVEQVVVNAAGCGSALKKYGHLLWDDPGYAGRGRSFSAKVRDLSELLPKIGPRAPRHALPLAVAYQDACHLAHAQCIRKQPRELLRAIPQLDVREVAEGDLCCGSAGIIEPEPARELGRRKAERVARTGAALPRQRQPRMPPADPLQPGGDRQAPAPGPPGRGPRPFASRPAARLASGGALRPRAAKPAHQLMRPTSWTTRAESATVCVTS